MERPQQMGKLIRRQQWAGRADPEQGWGHLCTGCGAQQPWQQLCWQLPQELGMQPAQDRLTGLPSQSKLQWHPLSDLGPTLGTRRSAGSQLARAGPQAVLQGKPCCRVSWAQRGIPSPYQAAAVHGTGNMRLWTQPGMRCPAPGMGTAPKRGTEAQAGVLQTHLFGCHIRKVPQGPQAVLDQPRAGAGQVLAQCLHATCREGDSPVSTPGHPSGRRSEQQQGSMV